MNDVNDFYAIGDDAKYEHIVAGRRRSEPWSEIRTQAVDTRRSRDKSRKVAKPFNKPFGMTLAVQSDMATDLDQVCLRLGRIPDRRHPRFFLAAATALIRARTAA